MTVSKPSSEGTAPSPIDPLPFACKPLTYYGTTPRAANVSGSLGSLSAVRVFCLQQSSSEQRNILSDSEHRPGDVTLPNWSGGRPLAIDVAVTSPFSAAGWRAQSPADAYSDAHK